MVRQGLAGLAFIIGLGGFAAASAPVDSSLRPVMRPGSGAGGEVVSVMRVSALVPTLRPRLRPADLGAGPRATQVKSYPRNAAFERWVEGFKPRARRTGISQRVIDRAFRGIRYNTDVIERDRNQAEFTKTIWEYLANATSEKRVRDGKRMLRRHGRLLNQIERKYGVDKEIVVAVWGLESFYGELTGEYNVIEAMATLAHDGRRGAFFEKQLIAALKILENGDTTPGRMKGSWAGAMGHTQFIPTSYELFAVDFTGDGKRDIWGRNPADALASTAAYLARSGWTQGMPWGVEVRLPQGFNRGLARRDVLKMPSQWAALGVRDVNGRAVRDYGSASILLPEGGRGLALMIFAKNFRAIERYNAADAYVIGVGHLADRLKGGAPFKGDFAPGERPLTEEETKDLQRALKRRGYPLEKIDGKIGPNTKRMIRAYQKSAGLAVDGYASEALLRHIKGR
ncbi:lytic murein transglycosylase [Rhodobacteraceae bacterium 63075]|nr:lytic murein transglycosylase [Rhodobacteraceae bacterium 63075]